MNLTLDLPQEDSEDFTSEEAQKAIPTATTGDLTAQIMQQVRGSKVCKFAVRSHELKRKNGHMYCRVRFVADKEPDKVMTYQIDWIIE